MKNQEKPDDLFLTPYGMRQFFKNLEEVKSKIDAKSGETWAERRNWKGSDCIVVI